jgi:hypothetical protein
VKPGEAGAGVVVVAKNLAGRAVRIGD